MAAAPPAHAARRIGHLHVRAQAAEDARHATVLIADALNTASLPGADRERLIVIRRLALGRIPVNGSAASVALQIEQAARDAVTVAVTIESAAADVANAVIFADRADALTALTRRLVRGGRIDQWFWPLVVPGWDPTLPRATAWVRLMDAAHSGPDAPALAAAVIEETVRAGGSDEWLAAVAPGDAARWLRLEGWSDVVPGEGAASTEYLWRLTSVGSAQLVGRWSARWGTSDARTIWLATLMTCIERPAAIGDARLPARVALALGRTEVAAIAMPMPGRPAPPDGTRGANEEHLAAGHTPGVGRPDRDPQNPRPLPVSAVARDETGNAPDREADGSSAGLTDRNPGVNPLLPYELAVPGPDGFFTHFAGIYFLVPVLERLHFAAFLAAHPEFLEDRFATRLLWFIARRAGLPATDPLAGVFENQCGVPIFRDTRAVAAWQFPAPVMETLASPLPRTPLATPELAWLTAVRRWCRRRARIGLTTLIRRPGRVHLSRTHIETSFALPELDLRVRRSALDVDPGWVPWLGHVVQFRYGGHDDR